MIWFLYIFLAAAKPSRNAHTVGAWSDTLAISSGLAFETFFFSWLNSEAPDENCCVTRSSTFTQLGQVSAIAAGPGAAAGGRRRRGPPGAGRRPDPPHRAGCA